MQSNHSSADCCHFIHIHFFSFIFSIRGLTINRFIFSNSKIEQYFQTTNTQYIVWIYSYYHIEVLSLLLKIFNFHLNLYPLLHHLLPPTHYPLHNHPLPHHPLPRTHFHYNIHNRYQIVVVLIFVLSNMLYLN